MFTWRNGVNMLRVALGCMSFFAKHGSRRHAALSRLFGEVKSVKIQASYKLSENIRPTVFFGGRCQGVKALEASSW